jgi:hypothetical protein
MWRDFVATLARPFTLDALASTHGISVPRKEVLRGCPGNV